MTTEQERLEALESLTALLLAGKFTPEHLTDLLEDDGRTLSEARPDLPPGDEWVVSAGMLQARRKVLLAALRLSVGALADDDGSLQ